MTSNGHTFRSRKLGAAAGALGLIAIAGAVGAVTSVDALNAGTVISMPQTNPATALPASFSQMIAAVSPAVVSVQVERKSAGVAQMRGDLDRMPREMRRFLERFFDENGSGNGLRRFGEPDPHRPNVTGVGSGFIVDQSGLIVTNHHVIAGAETITVKLDTGQTHNAELVGRDPKTDLALLKIDGGALPSVAFAHTDANVGDWVVAIGNPFGLGHSATTGIVSARHRNIGAGPYDDFLQIDAPINRGNSGGPVFNLKGEVVGINTAIFSPNGGSVGIGFAIPASLAEHVVGELEDDGSVDRGWLGVQIQPVGKDIADSLGLEEAAGAIVADVVAKSPAAAAELRQGDVILAVNGTAIKKMRELPRIIAAIPAGEAAELTVWRDGAPITLTVEIAALKESGEVVAGRKADPESASDTNVLGMALAELDDPTRDRYRVARNVGGMVVTAVEPGSPAAAKGIAPGDVIISVANRPAATPADVARAMTEAEQNEKKAMLFRIKRTKTERYVALPLPKA